MKSSAAPIRRFWLLALFAVCALGWSSYQALTREQDALKSRVFWRQQAEFRRVVDRLDLYLATLFGREATLSFDDFQSYRSVEEIVLARSIRGGMDKPQTAPIYIPTTLLSTGQDLPNPQLTKLHFRLGESLQVPGIPEGYEREIAIARGYTDTETLERLTLAKQALIQTFGSETFHTLLAESTNPKIGHMGGARDFTPLFVKPPTQASPELILVRRDPTAEDKPSLQCIWYDWPLIQAGLTQAARKEFPGHEYRIDPVLDTGRLNPARGSASTDARGGQLANLAARIAITSGQAPRPPGWTQLATNLSIAWLICLAALFAIHSAIIQTAALSERRAQFASAVTHELRTPLTTLCMYTEMLSAGLVKEEALHDYYATIRTEAERLAALIDNVLDHSGLEHGRSLNFESLDLATWLQAQTLPDVEVQLDNAQALPVSVDRHGLERILGNLVDNAKRYGAEPIQVALALAESQVQLRVSDGGPGIARTSDVFTAFVQGKGGAQDSSSTRGLGLGLRLSRDLARAMGGDLSLESAGPKEQTGRLGKSHARPARPTCFLLSLPLDRG